MGKRPRNQYRKLVDPLVPISGGRLAAALDLRKWAARDLAKRAQLPDSTIHYITSGERERCRRSVRAALARKLGYDAEWLGGERPDLPLPAGWRRPGLRLPGTPRAYLAAYELLNVVAKRVARGPRMPDDDVARLNCVLLDLLDPRAWREHLLRWAPRQRRDVRPEEMEVAVPALADALTVILGPWLRGYAVTLDMKTLIGLLPRGPRQIMLSASRGRDASPSVRQSGSAAADSEEYIVRGLGLIDPIDSLNPEGLSPEELARFNALEAEAACFNALAAKNDAQPKASKSRPRLPRSRRG